VETTKALVLNCVRYNDNGVVVSFFTERYGSISSLVRIPNTRRRNALLSLLQRLSLVEIEIDYRETRDMQSIRNVSLYYPWTSIPYNPVKASVAMFIAEFLYNALRSEGVNVGLFSFLEQSLVWFDQNMEGIANFHLLLPIKLTMFLGIMPNIEGYREGMFFDMQCGECVEVPPLHRYMLDRDETSFLPVLLGTDYCQMHGLAITREQRGHILEIIIMYYRLHVPGFRSLQSMGVLREVFA